MTEVPVPTTHFPPMFIASLCNSTSNHMWYIGTMYAMACLSTPINILLFYLIIFHTPPMAKYFRVHLFCYHAACTAADLVITVGTTPIIFTPYLMGYPSGILRFLDVSTLWQTFLALLCYVFILTFTSLLFFHRLQVVLPRQHALRVRDSHYPISVITLFCLLVFPVVFVFGFTNFQVEQMKRSFIEAVPCANNIVSRKEFLIFNPHLPPVWRLMLSSALSDGMASFLAVLFIVIALVYLRNARNISEVQRAKHRKLLVYLVLQVFIPFLCLVSFSFMLLSVYFQIHPARYVGCLMCLALACHGTLSTSLIIYFNETYLAEVRGMLKRMKRVSDLAVLWKN